MGDDASAKPEATVGGSNLGPYTQKLAGAITQPSPQQISYQKQYNEMFGGMPSLTDLALAHARQNLIDSPLQQGIYAIPTIDTTTQAKPVVTRRPSPVRSGFQDGQGFQEPVRDPNTKYAGRWGKG